jgi:hypothetical protein
MTIGESRTATPEGAQVYSRRDRAAREMRALADDPERWHALSAAGLAIARDKLCQPISPANYRRFLIEP